MNYYSLNKQAPNVTFREATVKGQAPDKGLYFPETFLLLIHRLLKISKIFKRRTCILIMQPYIGDTIDKKELFRIVSETINFPFPLYRWAKKFFLLNYFMALHWLLKMWAPGS
jgi:threonine synthase